MEDFELENDITNDGGFSDNENDENTDYNILDMDEAKDEDALIKFQTYKSVIQNIQRTTKKTIPFLTKFERARILGVRVQQIAYGAKPNVSSKGMNSIQEIVEEELKQRKIPFIIRRTLPNGMFEDWRMEEFELV